jgi:hypothetical protein
MANSLRADEISPGRLHENYAAIVTEKAFRNYLKKSEVLRKDRHLQQILHTGF